LMNNCSSHLRPEIIQLLIDSKVKIIIFHLIPLESFECLISSSSLCSNWPRDGYKKSSIVCHGKS
jgi:hypothetical protein